VETAGALKSLMLDALDWKLILVTI